MQRLLVLAALIAAFSGLFAPGVAWAVEPEFPEVDEDESAAKLLTSALRWPEVSLAGHAELAAWRAGECACFDRRLVGGGGTLLLRWSRFFGLEVGFARGRMVFEEVGGADYLRVQGAFRASLTSDTARWWDDFHVRVGIQSTEVSDTRSSPVPGVHLSLGHEIALWNPRLLLQTEVPFRLQGGDMKAASVGIQLGLRVSLNPLRSRRGAAQ